MCHSVRGFGDHRRTEPAARRRREGLHRAITPRVTEAADPVPRIQRATYSTNTIRCAVLAAAQAALIQAVFSSQRARAALVAPVAQCVGISTRKAFRGQVKCSTERIGLSLRPTGQGGISACHVRARTFVLALGRPERPEQLADRYRCLRRTLTLAELPWEAASTASAAEHTGP